VSQLLQIYAIYLSEGLSSRLIGADVLDKLSSTKNQIIAPLTIFDADMSTLAMHRDQLLVYGKEEYSYVDLDFYKKLKASHFSMTPEKRVLVLSSILANEFAFSAGLGRLAGTPLGNAFGSSSNDPVLQYVGVKNITNATFETANRRLVS
jgi:hypothetical protein